jgi:DNA-binding transcriptional ArsR family regulator/uncharacterized protein YndB with AHSA1/START domain
MTNQSRVLDALGDETRRGILAALATGPKPVGVLAAQLPISRPAVSQHLRVLKSAGLVVDRAAGTRRLYEIDPAGVDEVRGWLDTLWTPALDAFKAAAEELEEPPMTSSTQTAFRSTMTVAAPIERAFHVFTAGFDSWWPHAHHVGSGEIAEVVMEGGVGGRWFERGADGSETDWGRVLEWDPPVHISLAWHLSADWTYDPDPAKASRVNVRFTAVGERSTRVDFEHGDLDRYGDAARKLIDEISDDDGWPMLLGRYAAAAAS